MNNLLNLHFHQKSIQSQKLCFFVFFNLKWQHDLAVLLQLFAILRLFIRIGTPNPAYCCWSYNNCGIELRCKCSRFCRVFANICSPRSSCVWRKKLATINARAIWRRCIWAFADNAPDVLRLGFTGLKIALDIISKVLYLPDTSVLTMTASWSLL